MPRHREELSSRPHSKSDFPLLIQIQIQPGDFCFSGRTLCRTRKGARPACWNFFLVEVADVVDRIEAALVGNLVAVMFAALLAHFPNTGLQALGRGSVCREKQGAFDRREPSVPPSIATTRISAFLRPVQSRWSPSFFRHASSSSSSSSSLLPSSWSQGAEVSSCKGLRRSIDDRAARTEGPGIGKRRPGALLRQLLCPAAKLGQDQPLKTS